MENNIENLVLNTLEAFKCPLTSVEIYEYLICNGQSVEKEIFKSTVISMEKNGAIAYSEGYFYKSAEGIGEEVKKRIIKAESARNACKRLKSKEKYLKKIGKLKYLGVFGSFSNVKNPDGKESLLVIVEEKSLESTIKKLNIFFKLFRLSNKFGIEIVIEEPIKALDSKSIGEAKNLMSLEHVVNKDSTYERLIHKNLWIFEYFSNYPLNKLSMSYRVKS